MIRLWLVPSEEWTVRCNDEWPSSSCKLAALRQGLSAEGTFMFKARRKILKKRQAGKSKKRKVQEECIANEYIYIQHLHFKC